jgi:hypothetical protein
MSVKWVLLGVSVASFFVDVTIGLLVSVLSVFLLVAYTIIKAMYKTVVKAANQKLD